MISGANSIFYGETLLTTKNNNMEEDKKLVSLFTKTDGDIMKSTEL